MDNNFCQSKIIRQNKGLKPWNQKHNKQKNTDAYEVVVEHLFNTNYIEKDTNSSMV